MNKSFVNWVPIALLVLLAILTWWLDTKVQNKEFNNVTVTNINPDFYIERYQATRMNQQGERLYLLKGQKLDHFTKEKNTKLRSPYLIYYDNTNGPVSFQANQAKIEDNGGHVYFTDNVEINRPASSVLKPLHISTSELHVLPDEELAKTDKRVSLVWGDSKLSSVGLEFNNKTRMIYLLSNAKAYYENPRSNRQHTLPKEN